MIGMARERGCTGSSWPAPTPPTSPRSYLRRGRRGGAARRGRRGARRGDGPPWRHGARGRSTRSRHRLPRIRRAGRRCAAPGGRPVIRDLDALPMPAWDLVDIDRYRSIWLRAPRPLLAEHGHHPRLPLPLQLVRQAAVGPALPRPQPGERGRPSSSMLIGPLRARTTSGSWTTSWGSSRAGSPGSPTCSRSAGLRIPLQVPHPPRPRCCERGPSTPCAAPAARSSGWAPSRARRRSSTPWRRAPPWSRSARPPGACTAAGIKVAFFLQFGYPGETRDDVEQDPADGARLPARRLGMSVSYPLPGTPFYERVKGAARGQAALGGLRRPGHDVPGPVHDRLLPPAPHGAPHRVPGARGWRGSCCTWPRAVAAARPPPVQAGGVLYRWARLPMERIAARPAGRSRRTRASARCRPA